MNALRPRILLTLAASAIVATFLQGCDPVPRRTLNTEEKTADLYWIFSQFGENYAPLDYKQARFNMNWDTTKKAYLDAAAQTKTNEEFYDLMFRLVSEFKDAHTTASLTNSSLPGRAKVAYLGFTGIRQGKTLLVKELFPTIDAKSAYPIKEGDEILKLDGMELPEVVKSEMVKYRDLGHDEANLTFHMNRIFTRASTAMGQPKKDTAILTVKRGTQELVISMPWVVRDLVDFQREQSEAEKAKEPAKKAEKAGDRLVLADSNGDPLATFGFVSFSGALELPSRILERITYGSPNRRFVDGFRMVDNIAGWSASKTEAATPLEEMKEQRKLPAKAFFIQEAKTYPAFIAREKILDAEGKATDKTKFIGYIYLDTFSPEGDEETVLSEFKATLAAMKELGVNDVVIDLINNGGGSLVLGMQLAQALTSDQIEMPEMEFRLSDTWLDEFENSSRGAANDIEKELSRRMLNEMRDDQAAGRRLSRRYSAASLAPYSVLPNSDAPALKEKLNVVLMINEMCASMCDIFSGILQDNHMAKVVGTRSMGAGGNVVSHDQAPNSHLTLRQTESLILRKDGSYIENNGVTPDVAVPVNEYAGEKYETVYKKAVETLMKNAKN